MPQNTRVVGPLRPLVLGDADVQLVGPHHQVDQHVLDEIRQQLLHERHRGDVAADQPQVKVYLGLADERRSPESPRRVPRAGMPFTRASLCRRRIRA